MCFILSISKIGSPAFLYHGNMDKGSNSNEVFEVCMLQHLLSNTYKAQGF